MSQKADSDEAGAAVAIQLLNKDSIENIYAAHVPTFSYQVEDALLSRSSLTEVNQV